MGGGCQAGMSMEGLGPCSPAVPVSGPHRKLAPKAAGYTAGHCLALEEAGKSCSTGAAGGLEDWGLGYTGL